MGNTELVGSLSVNGNTELTGTLSVISNAEMGGTLSVAGNTKLSSGLSVMGNTELVGSLSVNGNTKLTGTLSVISNTEIGGSLSVAGIAYLKDDLSVNGHVELKHTLSVVSGVEFGSTLSINDSIYINTEKGIYTNKIFDATNKTGGGEIVIDVDTLKINGNLDVAGVYNTVDVDTTNIHTEDKLIILASTGNFDGTTEVDDLVDDSSDTNGEAGIKIAGKPTDTKVSAVFGNTNMSASNVWEKSIKWNYGSGNGMPNLGYLHDAMNTVTNNGRDSEPTWEIKGGPLYIVADKPWTNPDSGSSEIVSVKYGFRINANDELEIVKRVQSDTYSGATKRIAKFGVAGAF